MNNHITHRLIDGILYRCIDVGCTNFEAAADNRERVRRGMGNAYYDWLDSVLEALPFGYLPVWMPTGEEWLQRGLGKNEEDND